jgi:hypothetical protein
MRINLSKSRRWQDGIRGCPDGSPDLIVVSMGRIKTIVCCAAATLPILFIITNTLGAQP